MIFTRNFTNRKVESTQGFVYLLANDYHHVYVLSVHVLLQKLALLQMASALPAILVYKSKEVNGNFIRLKDDFDDDFFASDVESFLVE